MDPSAEAQREALKSNVSSWLENNYYKHKLPPGTKEEEFGTLYLLYSKEKATKAFLNANELHEKQRQMLQSLLAEVVVKGIINKFTDKANYQANVAPAVFEPRGCDLLISQSDATTPLGGIDIKGSNTSRGSEREKLPYGFPIIRLGVNNEHLQIDKLMQQLSQGSTPNIDTFIDAQILNNPAGISELRNIAKKIHSGSLEKVIAGQPMTDQFRGYLQSMSARMNAYQPLI